MSTHHSTFALAVSFVLLFGCGSDDSGGGTGGSSSGGTSSGGTSSGGSSATGGTPTGGTSAGGTSAGGTASGGTSTGGTSSDPLEAARQTCIDHINELRATKGRAPYQRWTSAEACVDEQATYDSTNGPHAAYVSGNTCGAGGQGECPGQGPSSVTGCIDLMWAEGDQSICSGCEQCPSLSDGFAGNCPNCKVQTSSPTCGHYLALLVSSFTQAACGFSTGSPYMAIDYQ